jgi:hypothetical protein
VVLVIALCLFDRQVRHDSSLFLPARARARQEG